VLEVDAELASRLRGVPPDRAAVAAVREAAGGSAGSLVPVAAVCVEGGRWAGTELLDGVLAMRAPCARVHLVLYALGDAARVVSEARAAAALRGVSVTVRAVVDPGVAPGDAALPSGTLVQLDGGTVTAVGQLEPLLAAARGWRVAGAGEVGAAVRLAPGADAVAVFAALADAGLSPVGVAGDDGAFRALADACVATAEAGGTALPAEVARPLLALYRRELADRWRTAGPSVVIARADGRLVGAAHSLLDGVARPLPGGDDARKTAERYDAALRLLGRLQPCLPALAAALPDERTRVFRRQPDSSSAGRIR
jgi:hypothetical protein